MWKQEMPYRVSSASRISRVVGLALCSSNKRLNFSKSACRQRLHHRCPSDHPTCVTVNLCTAVPVGWGLTDTRDSWSKRTCSSDMALWDRIQCTRLRDAFCSRTLAMASKRSG